MALDQLGRLSGPGGYGSADTSVAWLILPLYHHPVVAEPKEASWLLLIHQIPPKPAYFRVKVWRRLQSLGAVALKNSVYALPNTDEAREDFEWVLREIVKEGGEATLCEARLIEGLSDQEVHRSFHAARDADYADIAAAARKLESELPRGAIPDDRRSQVEVEGARR